MATNRPRAYRGPSARATSRFSSRARSEVVAHGVRDAPERPVSAPTHSSWAWSCGAFRSPRDGAFCGTRRALAAANPWPMRSSSTARAHSGSTGRSLRSVTTCTTLTVSRCRAASGPQRPPRPRSVDLQNSRRSPDGSGRRWMNSSKSLHAGASPGSTVLSHPKV
jgi:hypothetical protein